MTLLIISSTMLLSIFTFQDAIEMRYTLQLHMCYCIVFVNQDLYGNILHMLLLILSGSFVFKYSCRNWVDEQLKVLHETLPKSNIVVLMGDLDAKLGSVMTMVRGLGPL